MDSMLFLYDVELSLAEEMQKFEADTRDKWCKLPALKANTIYHMCPYFEDIEKYFEARLMRIADEACRKYREFSDKDIDLSWFQICNNYPDVITALCEPYIEAFEAVCSKGMNRLKVAKANLENKSSGRIHGYITNSFGYALAQETINAIVGALKAIENDRMAWESAIEPQQKIHSKLAHLWGSKFDALFMQSVSEENKAVASTIIEKFCWSFGYTYEKYCEIKGTQEFVNAFHDYTIAQNDIKEKKACTKQKKRQEYLRSLNCTLVELDEKLSNIGFALWGEKKSQKKELEKRRDLLVAEIRATEHPVPLKPTFTATIPCFGPAYANFMKNSDRWLESKEYWCFEYSEERKDYIAYTPENAPLFNLGQDFCRRYGRFRKIGAKYEGCPSATMSTADLLFSIFEIEE